MPSIYTKHAEKTIVPSEPTIDVEQLLKPISEANPAGGDYRHSALRDAIESKRKEAMSDEVTASQAVGIWAEVAALAQNGLKTLAKDLQLAARLTEALTKVHGFAGCRDGLQLMRRLVEECYDRLSPPLDPDDPDPDYYANEFASLNDQNRGMLYPYTIRSCPLLQTEQGPKSAEDFAQAQAAKAKTPTATADFEQLIDQAIRAASYDQLRNNTEDIGQALEEVAKISTIANTHPVLRGRFGFTNVKQALDRCKQLADELLKRKGPPPTDSPGPAPADASAGAAGAAVAAGAVAGVIPGSAAIAATIASREDIYRTLRTASDLLRQIEPHSPIPYLLDKAIALGRLSFPELIRELVRDADILSGINREFGLKPPEAGS